MKMFSNAMESMVFGKAFKFRELDMLSAEIQSRKELELMPVNEA
jgi:hypothetical protein